MYQVGKTGLQMEFVSMMGDVLGVFTAISGVVNRVAYYGRLWIMT